MSHYNKEELRQNRIEAKRIRKEHKRNMRQLKKVNGGFGDGGESRSLMLDEIFQNEQKQKALKRRRMLLLIATYSKIQLN